jgi:hypothetical protein
MAIKFNPLSGEFDLVGSGGTGTSSVTPLFDYYTDAATSGTAETDLYSSTIPAGQLAANGDKIFFEYSGQVTVDAVTEAKGTISFGGTEIVDPDENYSLFAGTDFGGAFKGWIWRGSIIRVSSSVVRASFSINAYDGTFNYSFYKEITGLTLSNTQVLKLVGQAPTAGTVTARMGTVYYQAAA